jgi:hypothetical protein
MRYMLALSIKDAPDPKKHDEARWRSYADRVLILACLCCFYSTAPPHRLVLLKLRVFCFVGSSVAAHHYQQQDNGVDEHSPRRVHERTCLCASDGATEGGLNYLQQCCAATCLLAVCCPQSDFPWTTDVCAREGWRSITTAVEGRALVIGTASASKTPLNMRHCLARGVVGSWVAYWWTPTK